MVAGATGLVGREIVKRLLADTSCARVIALVRQPLGMEHPKLQELKVDFGAPLHNLPQCDALLIALGTTIKAAGSKMAFRAVDFDAVLYLAGAAKAGGCKSIGVVSAVGPSKTSPVFYSRVKAEMEEAVAALGFRRTVFARPSLLKGDRAALGQAQRPGESWALMAASALEFLIPQSYRAVAAADVAAALVQGTLQGSGLLVLENTDLLGASR